MSDRQLDIPGGRSFVWRVGKSLKPGTARQVVERGRRKREVEGAGRKEEGGRQVNHRHRTWPTFRWAR